MKVTATIIPEATQKVNVFGQPVKIKPTNNYDRAYTLFCEGYRVELHPEYDLKLLIVKPDGTKYTYRPYDERCTCRGFVGHGYCKHSQAWWGLLQLTADEWAMNRNPFKCYQLMDFHFDYLCWLGGSE